MSQEEKELVEELASVVARRVGGQRQLAEVLRRAADFCEESMGIERVSDGGKKAVDVEEDPGSEAELQGMVMYKMLGGMCSESPSGVRFGLCIGDCALRVWCLGLDDTLHLAGMRAVWDVYKVVHYLWGQR